MNQSFLKTAKRIVLGLLAIVLTGGLALITVIAKPREQIFHNRHMSDTPATRKARIRAFITKHLCITMLAIGLMGFFAMIAIMAKPLDPVKRAISDFSFTDIYYEILKEGTTPDTSHLITIVDMTELTNRSEIADVMSRINRAQPKVLGVDICFDNEGEDFEGNDSLIRVVEQYHENMVFSLKMLDWQDDSVGWNKAIHSFFHEIIPLTEGTTNMPRQLYDSMKRKVPLAERYEVKYVPSFVAQVANRYAGQDIVKGRTDDVKINFSPTVFRVLSPQEVDRHPELIEGQIVLLGAVYEEADRHWTPLGKIAGVELLAYGVQSIVYSNEVKNTSPAMFAIVSLLVVFLVELLQYLYLERTGKSEGIFTKFIIGSTYFMSVLTFLFTSVLLGVCFVVFKLYGISFNLAWALTAITFLGTSRSMYAALKDYFIARRNKYLRPSNENSSPEPK